MEPTQEPGFIAALIDLIPIVGGAVIGIIGGLVGSKYSHNLNSVAEKATERRLKLETLVTECYEITVWLKKQENYYLYGGDEIIE